MSRAQRKSGSKVLADTLRQYLEDGFDMFGLYTIRRFNFVGPKPEIRGLWEKYRATVEDSFRESSENLTKSARPWAHWQFDATPKERKREEERIIAQRKRS